jgi:ribosome-associated toxin RatA of RatAB toxin-antitoxin module
MLPSTSPADVEDEPCPAIATTLSLHSTVRCSTQFEGFAIRAGASYTSVNAGLTDVRRTVMEYGHYGEFMPGFRSTVLRKEGADTVVRISVDILHGAVKLYANTRFSPPVAEGTGQRIEGRMVQKEGNVDDLRAVWHLTPVDDTHTNVRLELVIVPPIMAPAFIVTRELAYATDKAVSGARGRTEDRVRPVVQQVDAAKP